MNLLFMFVGIVYYFGIFFAIAVPIAAKFSVSPLTLLDGRT